MRFGWLYYDSPRYNSTAATQALHSASTNGSEDTTPASTASATSATAWSILLVVCHPLRI
jgi:hypothetical protein